MSRGPLLPYSRVAAGVKQRDDKDGLACLPEDNQVGEAAKKRLARMVWRRLGYSLHHNPQGLAEPRHDLRRVGFIPCQGVGKISPCGGGKADLRHSLRPPVKLALDLLPRDSRFSVIVERRHTSRKLGVLGGRQAHIFGRQAVPEISDQVEPFARRQFGDVECCHGEKDSSIGLEGEGFDISALRPVTVCLTDGLYSNRAGVQERIATVGPSKRKP